MKKISTLIMCLCAVFLLAGEASAQSNFYNPNQGFGMGRNQSNTFYYAPGYDHQTGYCLKNDCFGGGGCGYGGCGGGCSPSVTVRVRVNGQPVPSPSVQTYYPTINNGCCGGYYGNSRTPSATRNVSNQSQTSSAAPTRTNRTSTQKVGYRYRF